MPGMALSGCRHVAWGPWLRARRGLHDVGAPRCCGGKYHMAPSASGSVDDVAFDANAVDRPEIRSTGRLRAGSSRTKFLNGFSVRRCASITCRVLSYQTIMGRMR